MSLIGQQSESLCAELEAAGLKYTRNSYIAGDVRNTGTSIEIAADAPTGFMAVASVIKQWMKARSSRKIILTTIDYRIIHADRLSVEELARLLAIVKDSTAFDAATSGLGHLQTGLRPAAAISGHR